MQERAIDHSVMSPNCRTRPLHPKPEARSWESPNILIQHGVVMNTRVREVAVSMRLGLMTRLMVKV